MDDPTFLKDRLDHLEKRQEEFFDRLLALGNELSGLNPAKAEKLGFLQGTMEHVPDALRRTEERCRALETAGLEPRLARVEKQLDALLEMLARLGLGSVAPPARTSSSDTDRNRAKQSRRRKAAPRKSARAKG